MTANIEAYNKLMNGAVADFWITRKRASKKQNIRGIRDQGNRSSVTAGKNLDGFAEMIRQIIRDNGVGDAEIYTEGRSKLTIPGFFRPSKNWDLIVISRKRLLAAIELKSQVGPSFGNNFNNRVEESLGNSTDLNTAFREGAFGESPKPFTGYFFILEESPKSLSNVRITSPHFPAMPEFLSTSYAYRYEILCRKLMQEQLYDSAALVLTPEKAESTGEHRALSELTSARSFAINLAGKMASMSLL